MPVRRTRPPLVSSPIAEILSAHLLRFCGPVSAPCQTIYSRCNQAGKLLADQLMVEVFCRRLTFLYICLFQPFTTSPIVAIRGPEFTLVRCTQIFP